MRGVSVDANDIQVLEIRIRKVEQWQQTFDALNAERRDRDAAEFKRVHDRLDKIDSHVSRVVWLIVATIVGGIMTFILQGGLTVAGG